MPSINTSQNHLSKNDGSGKSSQLTFQDHGEATKGMDSEGGQMVEKGGKLGEAVVRRVGERCKPHSAR